MTHTPSARTRPSHRSHPGPRFFIIGVQRSGTTLLRSMLDRHPLVSIPPESHFIPWLFARRARYGEGSRIDRIDRFVADLSRHPRFAEWGISRERVQELLEGTPHLKLADAISVVYTEYAMAHGKGIAGDKTPRYAEHVPLLSTLFPAAAFVHLIRDGRDVALSIMDTNPERHHSPASAAFFWRRRLGMVEHATKLIDGRYREVRYEALLADPKEVLLSLCEFLGIQYSDALLEHDDRLLRQLSRPHQRLHKNLALPPTKGLRDFASQMDPAGIREFEAIAGRQLLERDYRLKYPPPRLPIRVKSWSRVAWFGARTYVRRRWRRWARMFVRQRTLAQNG